MRYSPFVLLLVLFLLGPLSVATAVPKPANGLPQGASESGSRGSTTVARAIRSGPMFGLAAIAAFTATRAARDPVSMFASSELSNNAPIAVTAATNTLLNTAKTTVSGTSFLPVVSPNFAAAKSSVSKLGLEKLASVRHAPGSSAVQRLLGEGLMYIGVPYLWGGTDPLKGLDCSGLVQVVFRNAAGITLPRTAIEQAGQGNRVNQRELKPADLVFFNTIGNNISHVGIYVGDGKFLHAPATGKFVRIDKIYSRFWTTRYVTARRMIEDSRNVPTRLAAVHTEEPQPQLQ